MKLLIFLRYLNNLGPVLKVFSPHALQMLELFRRGG